MSLDENGQTRIDMSSTSQAERGDLGRNARRIRKFFRVLDERSEAGPGTILDPTVPLIRMGLLVAGTPRRLRAQQMNPPSETRGHGDQTPSAPLETSRPEATKGLSCS